MKKSFAYIGFTLLISFYFTSCGSLPKYKTERSKWTIPEIGVETTSYIGDTIIIDGIRDATKAIELKADINNKSSFVYHPKGSYLYCGDEKINVATNKFDIDHNRIYKDFIFEKYSLAIPNGIGWTTYTIYKYGNGEVYYMDNKTPKKIDYNKYKVGYTYGNSGYYYEQQLIYTGSEGNILKFAYRELQDNTARPAFSLEATYDISKDKTLRFKNCCFEVISVNNQSITYKLISGFKTLIDAGLETNLQYIPEFGKQRFEEIE